MVWYDTDANESNLLHVGIVPRVISYLTHQGRIACFPVGGLLVFLDQPHSKVIRQALGGVAAKVLGPFGEPQEQCVVDAYLSAYLAVAFRAPL
jgi:hypothetical protein